MVGVWMDDEDLRLFERAAEEQRIKAATLARKLIYRFMGKKELN